MSCNNVWLLLCHTDWSDCNSISCALWYSLWTCVGFMNHPLTGPVECHWAVLTLWVLENLMRCLWPFGWIASDLRNVTQNWMFLEIIDKLRNVLAFVVIVIVPADGLAPLGARPSASTLMTTFMSLIHTGPALQAPSIPISALSPACPLISLVHWSPPTDN